MPEKPLLIFPSAEPVARPTRTAGFSAVPQPTDFKGQAKRIEEQFAQVQAAFVSDEAGDIERVLVMETSNRIDGLQKAVVSIPGLEWLAEMDVDDIDLHDIYDESTGKQVKGGRFYLLSSNKQATDSLLGLWNKYQSGEQLPHGYGKFKDIFSYLITLRRWDVGDRLRDTGILEIWKGDYEAKKGTTSFLDFEIELHYRKAENKRKNTIEKIRQKIEDAGGQADQSVCIEDIAFHALKATLPVSCLDEIANLEWKMETSIIGLSPIFDDEGIRYIRPVGQHIEGQGELPEYPVTKQFESIEDLPPVIALLDGAPLLRHVQLDNRLVFSDPENYLSDYEPGQQKHGTAMASLICHGDLNRLRAEIKSLPRRIYVRPVMKPNAKGQEQIPGERFQEDIIELSVREMFEGESPKAPDVRVINLSLGNIDQIYLQEMSPWARLLDWLSFKYRVLFIVSAGNYNDPIQLADTANNNLLSPYNEKVILGIEKNQRNHRLFSPAESMNSITVGSLQNDSSGELSSNIPAFDPIDDESLPAPYSRVGPGYRGTIKPDVFTSGGRLLYDKNPLDDKILDPVITNAPPGVQTASPGHLPESLTNTTFQAGTSHAAATVSHAAGHIYEMLEALREENADKLSRDFDALLIKALLVHSVAKGESSAMYDILKNTTNRMRFKGYLSRYLGYGAVNFDRVLECTQTRATAIGYGTITDKQRHRYKFPIPAGSSIGSYLRLTITLAWFTPINPFHVGMRRAKLWLEGVQGHQRLESDWQQVRKGTVQHEIFDLDKTNLPGDILELFVECSGDAGELDDEIPYGLAVTLEVAEQEKIDLYQIVRDRTRQPVEIAGRNR